MKIVQLLFKWINSLEQYKHKGKCMQRDSVTAQVNYNSLEQYKHKGKCMQRDGEEQTWRQKTKRKTVMGKANWLVYQYCHLFRLFPLYSLLVSVSWALSLRFRPSLSTGFSSFVFPCSADFVCKTWSRDRKAVPASFLFLFSFFIFFLFFLFYCLPSFSFFILFLFFFHLSIAFFPSPTASLSFVFSCLFSFFFSSFSLLC